MYFLHCSEWGLEKLYPLKNMNLTTQKTGKIIMKMFVKHKKSEEQSDRVIATDISMRDSHKQKQREVYTKKEED